MIKNLIKKSLILLGVVCSSIAFSQDLTIMSFDQPMKAYLPGYTLKMYYKEANLGGADVKSYVTAFYLSKDTLLGNDTFITKKYPIFSSSISANTQKLTTAEIVFPNIEPGEYYLLAIIDAGNEVTETNELNNIKWMKVSMLKIGIVDLNITNLRAGNVTTTGRISSRIDIKNLGNTSIHNYSIQYYLSKDTILKESEDIYLESLFDGSPLYNHDSTIISFDLYKSSLPNPDDYYLIIKLLLGEGYVNMNPQNNVKFTKISIFPNNPDMAVEYLNIAVKDKICYPGKELNINMQEVNNSLVAIPAHTLGFYLSQDKVKDASDALISTTSMPAYTKRLSPYTEAYMLMPISILPGKYYVLTVLDYKNEIVELNEANNIHMDSITVVLSTIDLVPTGISTSSTAGIQYAPGILYTQISTQKNLGTDMPNSNITAWYLSSDTLLSVSDSLIGTTTIPGNSSGNYIDMRIPTNTPLGSYYILIVADSKNNNKEINEANNILAVPIQVTTPATDIRNVIASASASITNPGAAITVYAREGIATGFAVNSHQAGFYISKDTSYSADDLLLATSSIMKNNETKLVSFNATLTIPLNTATGNYYLLVFYDHKNEVSEINENNNIGYMPVKVLANMPDLGFTVVNFPATVSQSGATGLAYTETNTGTLSAPAHKIGFYISSDSTLSTDDILVTNISTATLAAKGTYSSSTTISPPQSLISGNSYYLIVANDYNNTVTESDEANNFVVLKFRVLPALCDLVIKNFSLIKTELTNNAQSISITLEESNIGPGSTDPFRGIDVGIYFSKDSIKSDDDVYNGSVALVVYQIKGNETTIQNTSFLLKEGLPPGDYYIILEADPSNYNKEIDETNNFKSQKIKIIQAVTDVSLAFFGTSPTVKPGYAFIAGYKLKNQGNTALTGVTTTLYLSSDDVFDATDLSVKSFITTLNNPGDTVRSSISISLPTGTLPGNYYLLLITDDKNIAKETNELNNKRVAKINVTLEEFVDVAITISSKAPTVYVAPGIDFTTNTIVASKNLGTAPITNVTGFYLSTDTIWDANDNPRSLYSYGTFYPGDSLLFNYTSRFPTSVSPGTYYVLYVGDPRNQYLEPNESNNIVAVKIVVTGIVTEVEEKIIKETQNQVHVYPNPAKGTIHIDGITDLQEPILIELYDALGRFIQTVPYHSKGTEVYGLPQGLYHIHIKTAQKTLRREKLFIED